MRVAIDRRHAHLGQRPADNGRVFGGPRDTIKASEKKYRRADTDNDCQPANHRKDTHVGLQRVRLPRHYLENNTSVNGSHQLRAIGVRLLADEPAQF